MKIAVLSDIHSNLEALQVVLVRLEQEKVESLYCLGDMVGYNANPRECLKLIRERNPICVAGNHDYGAVGLTDIEGFNDYAKAAVLWCASQLDQEEKAFLRQLPVVRKEGQVTLVHGTLDRPEEWGYILSVQDARMSLQFQETPLCFVGHSHVPFVFQEGEDYFRWGQGQYLLDPAKRTLVNPGSVGQPRDRDPRASFVLFDDQAWSIQLVRVPYDIATTQQKVLAAGLPVFLAQRLAFGR